MFTKTKSWVFSHKILSAVIVFFSLIIISIALTPVPPKTATEKEVKVEIEQKVVFDVPSLFDKNIDEVKQVLGTPKNDTELTELQMQGSDEWSKEFNKDGYTLTVTYRAKSRLVTDFFVSATDEIYNSGDKTKMLKLTNTQEGNKSYSVEFVKALKDPSKFTGILIKQN
jgi:hypothetical protein